MEYRFRQHSESTESTESTDLVYTQRVMRRVVSLLASLLLARSSGQPPNIVVMVADDLGFSDISWHNQVLLTPCW